MGYCFKYINEYAMRIYEILVLIFFGFCFYNCGNQSQEAGKSISINQTVNNYDSLISEVTKKGSIDAYDELFYGFIDSNVNERIDSVLKYSGIMALNFGYERAYYDHLSALCEKYDIKTGDNMLDFHVSDTESNSYKVIVNWLNKMLQNKVISQEQFNQATK